jgi:hypothetical protein
MQACSWANFTFKNARALYYTLDNMDIEKTIQFLLDQQARFEARQARLEEWHNQFAQDLAKLTQDVSQINGVLLELAAAQERTNRIVAVLAERQVELTESHKATEEKLHTLITIVERHIASHN